MEKKLRTSCRDGDISSVENILNNNLFLLGYSDTVSNSLENTYKPATTPYRVVKVDNKNNYAIRWASRNGHLPVVECLLKYNKIIETSRSGTVPLPVTNSIDIHDNNYEALRWASRNGHLPIVQLLINTCLQKAGFLEYQTSDSPSSEYQSLDIPSLKHLVDMKAIYESLKSASSNGHLPVVEYLLKYIPLESGNRNIYPSLLISSKAGHLPIVKYLLESRNTDSSRVYYCLIEAIESGHFPVVEYLSKQNGIHLSMHTLGIAIYKDNLPIVKYLLENGVDIRSNEDEALRYASKNGKFSIVKYLLENGSDIHANDDEALRKASKHGHLPVIEYLISQGADIHAKDDYALRMATRYGHLPIVKYLIYSGANIFAEDLYKNYYYIRNLYDSLSKIKKIKLLLKFDKLELLCTV